MESERKIVVCEDGTQTILWEKFGETYHSNSGSVTEGVHVFIKNGLMNRISNLDTSKLGEGKCPITLKILEYGFGSGLNVLLTLRAMEEEDFPGNIRIEYTSLEKYPLKAEEYRNLNYAEISPHFRKIHETPWGDYEMITEKFKLKKVECDFRDYDPRKDDSLDVVYFDAFSPTHQEELWTPEIFARISEAMSYDAVLSTYCSKGTVKEALRNAGLFVKRVKGTGHKRHIVTAYKKEER